jgi:hypothetical protein
VASEGEDLGDLVDIADLRVLLGRGSRRGEPVAPSYAHTISRDRTFPKPAVLHPPTGRPRVRLWRRADVERWLDEHRDGWRETPPAD